MSGGHINPKPAEKEKLSPAHLIEKRKSVSHAKLQEIHDTAATIKNAARSELDRRGKADAMKKSPGSMSTREFDEWSKRLIQGDGND